MRPTNPRSEQPVTAQRSAPAQRKRALLAIAIALASAYLCVRFLWSAVQVLLVGGALYYLFAPVVRGLARWRVPRLLSALVLAFLLVVGLGVAGGTLLPRLFDELRQFASQLPPLFDAAERWLSSHGLSILFDEQSVRSQLARLQSWVMGGASWLVTRTLELLSTVVALLLGLIMCVYLLNGGERLAHATANWIPPSSRERWVRFGHTASRLMAGYVRARVISSLFIGTSYWVAFMLLGLRQAILLAVVGGLLNLIPLVGPLLAAVPVLLMAIFDGWATIVGVLVVQIVAQQVESGILDPLLAGHYVRLPAAVVIVAVATGGALLGIPGMLVAVPVAALVREALLVFYRASWETSP